MQKEDGKGKMEEGRWGRGRLLLLHLFTLVAVFAVVWPVSASEKFLKDALRKDETLGEVNTRLTDMEDRQDASNVFEGQEIERTGKARGSMEDARETSMKAVIEELGKGLVMEELERSPVYSKTREHYRDLLDVLRGVKDDLGQQVEERNEMREMLEEQEEILKETKELHEKLQQRKPKMEDLQKLAELAEREESLTNHTDSEDLKKDIQRAESALSQMETEDAVDAQELLIEKLQQQLRAEVAPPPEDSASQEEQSTPLTELALEIEQLTSLSTKLEKIEDKVRREEKRSRKKPVSPEFQQETAMEMNEAAEELREHEIEPAANDMMEAMQELVQEKLEESADSVKDARQKLEDALAAKLQQLQEMAESAKQKKKPKRKQPEPELALDSGDEEKPQNSGLSQQPQKPPQQDDGWKANLPDRERAALLSAREAKFDPRWEEEVKRYFVEIAR